MSDAESQTEPAQRVTEPDSAATVMPASGLDAAPAGEEPTVGTGSVFAIGCVAGTLLFVVIAIVVAVWLR